MVCSRGRRRGRRELGYLFDGREVFLLEQVPLVEEIRAEPAKVEALLAPLVGIQEGHEAAVGPGRLIRGVMAQAGLDETVRRGDEQRVGARGQRARVLLQAPRRGWPLDPL